MMSGVSVSVWLYFHPYYWKVSLKWERDERPMYAMLQLGPIGVTVSEFWRIQHLTKK